jgi:hypothetical protein
VIFLMLALAGTIGAMAWLAPRLPVRTSAFDAVLARLQSANASLAALARGDGAPLLSPGEVATAAGLYGVAALAGPHFVLLEQMLRTPAFTSSGSSSGADGGGCGGGCGGCGGCGG